MDKNETKVYISRILKKYEVTGTKIATQLGFTRQHFSQFKTGKRALNNELLLKLEQLYPLETLPEGIVAIPYYKDVRLSAGYGTINYDEKPELMYVDKNLLLTRKGLRINEKNCHIAQVSGNSMYPEYIDGDRVIIDSSVKTFVDGFVFSFTVNGDTYIKLINLTPGKVKCISVNPDFDTFYISPDDTVVIHGMVLPRIRL